VGLPGRLPLLPAGAQGQAQVYFTSLVRPLMSQPRAMLSRTQAQKAVQGKAPQVCLGLRRAIGAIR
jgi:hypothetical protein